MHQLLANHPDTLAPPRQRNFLPPRGANRPLQVPMCQQSARPQLANLLGCDVATRAIEASTTAKKALEVVAWERLQDECNAKDQFIEQLKHHAKIQEEFFKGEIEALEDDARLWTARFRRQNLINQHLETWIGDLKEEKTALTTKVAELESENERLRNQLATAPPAKRVCSITQRIYRK